MADRRIERTRANVFRAMLDLVSTCDWHKITVKDLCNAADINKSTFYLHFSDMYDCREQWLVYSANEAIAIDSDSYYSFDMIFSNPKPYLCTVLDFFEAHRHQYQVLFNSPFYGMYIHDFKQCAMDIICKKNNIKPTADYNKYTTIIFLLGGIIDTVFGALNNFDKDKILEALTSFATGVVSARGVTPMRSVNAY